MTSPLPPGPLRLLRGLAPSAVAVAVAAAGAARADAQWEGSTSAVLRHYPTARADLPAWEVAWTGQATRRFSWGEGAQLLTVTSFVRTDPDTFERSRVDLLDAAWERLGERWELLVGAKVVSWGVVESTALVDVINQRDYASDALQPLRMGQPVAGGRLFLGVGTVEAYLLPWHRPRRFDGREATLRTERPIAVDAPRFEDDGVARHLAWSARWSHFLGPLDVALSHFRGTDRAPRAAPSSAPDQAVIPFYERIAHTAVELQWTHGSWLVKLEALRRAARGDVHGALAGGIEYSFADYLSWFVEYVHDDRPVFSSRTVDRDVFLGARLLTQDWTLSLRGFVDAATGNAIASTTATRRISGSTTVTVDARSLLGERDVEPQLAHLVDAFVELRLSTFF